MNRIGVLPFVVLAVAALIAIFNAFFIVHQTEYAIVLQFGEIRKVVKEPGIKVKLPFVQTVDFLDKRILRLDSPPEEMIAADRKRLVVDAFAQYRIIDPDTYYRAVRTDDTARSRLHRFVTSEVRNTLGEENFSTVLSEKRAALMRQIRDKVNKEAREFGIEVVDVKIRRADLPQENSEAIYRRMQAERQQQAAQIRAQGTQEALGIRAKADRDVTVLIAEARRDSEILRGTGDAERNRVYAEAFNKDPDFFTFYRSMRAYEEALQPGTTMVLAPDSEFFRYFRSANGGR